MAAADTDVLPRKTGVGLAGRGRLANALYRFGLVLAWLGVIMIFGLLEPDTFLTTRNAAAILGSQAPLVLLTLALILPLTAGDFDLSVAANLTLSAMVIAILNAEVGWPLAAAIATALAIGALVGIVNALLITGLGIFSLISTLATGTILSGIVLWISDSKTVAGVSGDLVSAVVSTRLFEIPLAFYFVLVVCAAIWYVFEFTPTGRRLLFVGRGRDVAYLIGVRVKRVRFAALVAAGILAALAGVLWVGTTGAADPVSGHSLLLPAFAAAFLGATAIIPGQFNPWGSLIAVYFLVTGITGLQLLGAEAYVHDLFYGGALAIAVALSQIARGRQEETSFGDAPNVARKGG